MEAPVALTIDYYFAPNSPYVYLGHARFVAISKAAGATVRVLPVDLGGKVFPISGGLPLSKRAPQRQAYRLVELKRFSEWLVLPLNVQPKYFPVAADDAAKLIIAVDLKDGTEAALKLTGAVLRAVWVEERNIADEGTLVALLAEQGMNPARLEESHSQTVYEPGFLGGVTVTNVTTPQGESRTVFGTGLGGGPRIRIFGPGDVLVKDFFAFGEDFRGGVFVG